MDLRHFLFLLLARSRWRESTTLSKVSQGNVLEEERAISLSGFLLAGKSKSFFPACLSVDWKWARFTLGDKVLSHVSAIIFTLFIMVSVLALVILTSVWLSIYIYFYLFIFTKGRTEDLIFQHEEFYLVGYDCASRALQSSGLTRSRPYASILLSSIMVLAWDGGSSNWGFVTEVTFMRLFGDGMCWIPCCTNTIGVWAQKANINVPGIMDAAVPHSGGNP